MDDYLSKPASIQQIAEMIELWAAMAPRLTGWTSTRKAGTAAGAAPDLPWDHRPNST